MASKDEISESPDLNIRKACDHLRLKLKECIKQSECVQKLHRPAADCVKAKDGTVPKLCYDLMQTFSACKRSMVDMRARFRGLKGSETK